MVGSPDVQRGKAHAAPTDTQQPLPRPGDLLAALGLLTVLPLRRPARESEAFGRATLFFPLVGLCVGALLVGLDTLLTNRAPGWLSAVVLVAVWAAVGGAEWLRETPQSHAGRYPVAALGAALMIVKVVALGVTAIRPAALLFAPTLARWAIVVLAIGARDAQAPGRKFNAAISFREFALTSVFSFAVVFTIAEAFGILVVLCVAALTLGLRLLAHRRLHGVTWRFLLISAEAIEALVVSLFMLA